MTQRNDFPETVRGQPLVTQVAVLYERVASLSDEVRALKRALWAVVVSVVGGALLFLFSEARLDRSAPRQRSDACSPVAAVNKLLLASLVAGLTLWAVFVFVNRAQNVSADRLCTVVARIVAGSAGHIGKPGTAGYSYYHAHPAELAAARRAALAELGQLPCKP